MPPLHELYANTEVTVFGITGTLDQLRGLCPHAEDPTKMTTEAMDKFAAVVLQEAGVELPEEFAHLRAPKADEQAPAVAEPRAKAEKFEPIAQKPEENASKPIENWLAVENAQAETKDPRPLPGLSPPEKSNTLPIVHKTAAIIATEGYLLERPTELAERQSEAARLAEAMAAKMLPEDKNYIGDADSAPSKGEAEKNPVHAWEPASPRTFEASQVTRNSQELALPPLPDFLPATAYFTEKPAHEYSSEKPHPETEVFAEQNTPDAIFNRFVEALQLTFQEVDDEARQPRHELGLELTGQSESPAKISEPVVREVADRLATLAPAEKEIAIPIAQEITTAIQKISTLRLAEAPTEKIAAAEQALTELVARLFKAIGIDPDEEKVRQFAQALVEPELMQRVAYGHLPGIEGVGTHEIKRYFREFFAMLAGMLANVPTRRLLGMFAVFHSNPSLNLAQLSWA